MTQPSNPNTRVHFQNGVHDIAREQSRQRLDSQGNMSRRGIPSKLVQTILGTGVATSLFGTSASSLAAPSGRALCDWVDGQNYCDFSFEICENRECFKNYREYRERCCRKTGCYYTGRRKQVRKGCCFC